MIIALQNDHRNIFAKQQQQQWGVISEGDAYYKMLHLVEFIGIRWPSHVSVSSARYEIEKRSHSRTPMQVSSTNMRLHFSGIWYTNYTAFCESKSKYPKHSHLALEYANIKMYAIEQMPCLKAYTESFNGLDVFTHFLTLTLHGQMKWGQFVLYNRITKTWTNERSTTATTKSEHTEEKEWKA